MGHRFITLVAVVVVREAILFSALDRLAVLAVQALVVKAAAMTAHRLLEPLVVVEAAVVVVVIILVAQMVVAVS